MPDRYQPLRDAIATGPTKGPWQAGTDGKPDNDMHHGVIAECNDLWIAAMYRSGTTVDGDDRSPKAEAEAAANARYVAAADPDTIDALLKERDALRDALGQYANPLNWSCDEQGIRRCWEEPGSSSPSAYNGFEAARAALADGRG